MKENFDTTKENYESGAKWHAEKSEAYNWQKQIEKFINHLESPKILDAGCGIGRDIKEFLKRRVLVEGLDYSSELLKMAQERFPDVKFYEADLRKTSLPDNNYDGIWACASLLNFRKKEMPQALKELWRILKKGGRLFVSVKEGVEEGFVSDRAGKRWFSLYFAQEISNLVEEAGFDVENLEMLNEEYLTGKITEPPPPRWIAVYANKV